MATKTTTLSLNCMNTEETTPKILTPEIVAQLKKASDEGKFGKEKMESAKRLIEKGLLEKLDAFIEQQKKES